MTTPIAHTGFAGTISIGAAVLELAKAFTPPGITVGTVDVKPLGIQWVGRLPTVTDGGKCTASVYLDEKSTTFQAVFALVGAPASTAVVVTFPGAGTWTFNAYVTGITPSELNVDDASTADIELSVTGQVVAA